MSQAAARQAAAAAARESYGRLVAWLARQWRDPAAAEDALSTALLKALERWPVDGIPTTPEAWLLAVARRELLQVARHDQMRLDPAMQQFLSGDGQAAAAPPEIPDERLRLMLVCAHPAIAEAVRMPLMLQLVLGLQVAEIAPAMLQSPAALAQRLVRAKQQIRAAGLRFDEPEPAELAPRLQPVLECIYGAFGMATTTVAGAESRISDLRREALWLGQIVCQLSPHSPEALGLLALMQFCQARQAAGRSAAGDFVPLALQDPQRWDRALIVQADQLLWRAARLRQPGPYQLEAAVQSAHCHRLFTGTTPWSAIAALYQQINQHYPTIGSQVAGAVAAAEAGQLASGLQQLASIDADRIRSFQPWWVARAHLLRLDGQPAQADAALSIAIGLSSDPVLRDYLQRQMLQPSSGIQQDGK